MTDMTAAIAELDRCAKLGLRAAMISGNPPVPHGDHVYDVFWLRVRTAFYCVRRTVALLEAGAAARVLPSPERRSDRPTNRYASDRTGRT